MMMMSDNVISYNILITLIIIIVIIIIPMTIIMLLSLQRQLYARVHCGSFGAKSVSVRVHHPFTVPRRVEG